MGARYSYSVSRYQLSIYYFPSTMTDPKTIHIIQIFSASSIVFNINRVSYKEVHFISSELTQAA